MRKLARSTAIIGLLTTMAVSAAPDDLASLKRALDQKFVLTTTTDDRANVVAAGSVLILKKGNLLTTEASRPIVFVNTYKSGKITQDQALAMAKVGETRTFLPGEKVWVTRIEVNEKEVVFELYADAVSGVTYRAQLIFPLENGAAPTANGILATVAEVLDVQPWDATVGPKEIKLGQTPDQVVAKIGQPDKVIQQAAKQVYVYKNMEVVFVAGKLSDVR